MKQTFTIYRIDILLFIFLCWLICNQYIIKQSSLSIFTVAEWSVLGICFIGCRCINKKDLLPKIIVVIGVLQSIIVFFQKMQWIESRNSHFVITGTFDNPSQLGAWLAVALIAAVFIFNQNKSIWCYIAGISLFGIIPAIISTNSRASWLGACFGILYWCITSKLIRIKEKRQAVLVSIFIIIFLGLCIGGYYYKQASANGRLFIWKVSTKMITDHPITGMGNDGFRTHYVFYQANYFQKYPHAKEAALADNTIYPYNEIFKLWIEQGLIGILLFTATLLTCFTNKEHCFQALLVGILVYSTFSYTSDVLILSSLFFLILGCIKGYPAFTGEKNAVYICLLGGILLLLLGIIAKGSYHYIHLNNNLKRLYSSSNLAESRLANGALERNYDLVKTSPVMMDLYAQYYFNNFPEKQRTMQILFDASKIAPTSELFCDIGDMYLSKKKYQKTEQYYHLANHILPHRLIPQYKLLQFYQYTEDTIQAVAQAKKILSTPLKTNNTLGLKIKGEAKRYLLKQKK